MTPTTLALGNTTNDAPNLGMSPWPLPAEEEREVWRDGISGPSWSQVGQGLMCVLPEPLRRSRKSLRHGVLVWAF